MKNELIRQLSLQFDKQRPRPPKFYEQFQKLSEEEQQDIARYIEDCEDIDELNRQLERLKKSDYGCSEGLLNLIPDIRGLFKIKSKHLDQMPFPNDKNKTNKIKASVKKSKHHIGSIKYRLGRITIKCLIKPGQSGKTNRFIELLNDNKQRGVTVVFSDNNRLLSEQTANRINQESDSECIAFNNKNKMFKTVKDVGYYILKTKNPVITVCDHPARWKDIDYLIKDNPTLIWTIVVDEEDKSPGLHDKYLKDWAVNCLNVVEYVLITATPYKSSSENIWRHEEYGDIHIVDLDHASNPYYIAMRDYNKILYDFSDDDHEYVANILKHHYPKDNDVWFTPAKNAKESHIQMVKTCLDNGFKIVVLINGTQKGAELDTDISIYVGKQFITFDKIRLELDDPDAEVSKILCHIKQKYAKTSPMAITGHLCVGRGITMQTDDGEGFFITHAIIPPSISANNCTLYQICVRLGCPMLRFMKHRNYPLPQGTYPTIFSNNKTFDKIFFQERIAFSIATMATGKNECFPFNKEQGIEFIGRVKHQLPVVMDHRPSSGVEYETEIIPLPAEYLRRKCGSDKPLYFDIFEDVSLNGNHGGHFRNQVLNYVNKDRADKLSENGFQYMWRDEKRNEKIIKYVYDESFKSDIKQWRFGITAYCHKTDDSAYVVIFKDPPNARIYDASESRWWYDGSKYQFVY